MNVLQLDLVMRKSGDGAAECCNWKPVTRMAPLPVVGKRVSLANRFLPPSACLLQWHREQGHGLFCKPARSSCGSHLFYGENHFVNLREVPGDLELGRTPHYQRIELMFIRTAENAFIPSILQPDT